MGAGAFHGRVRDGNGCCSPAVATGPPGRSKDHVTWMGLGEVSGNGWWMVCVLMVGDG